MQKAGEWVASDWRSSALRGDRGRRHCRTGLVAPAAIVSTANRINIRRAYLAELRNVDQAGEILEVRALVVELAQRVVL